MDEFIKEYEKQLILAITNYPTEYIYSLDKVPEVMARMKEAFKKKSYNKDSRAIKNTCKILKIKHTYTAINEFIKG